MNRRSTCSLACIVVLTGSLAACSNAATPSLGAPMPAHESATIPAGVDAIPADARLSIDAASASSSSDPTTRDHSHKLYADHTNLALGLINRYLLKPYTNGRFTVTVDTGPGSKTLGRAAAATTAAITALDLALPDAPTHLRQPTLLLRTQLSHIDHALRNGGTLDPAAANATTQQTLTLRAASKSDHLTLRPGKTPDLTPVTVTPRWKATLKATIHQVQTLTNRALGAVRRYVQRPAERGKLSSAASPKTARRTQHRAALALDFAAAQLATAARACTGIARLSQLHDALVHAHETIQRAAGLARHNRLNTVLATPTTSTIVLLERAGETGHLKIHPGRSPTFLS